MNEILVVHDDGFRILRRRRTPQGFLDVWGVSAKVGPLDYPEHGRRVWVSAEVLADTSTLADAPLVAEHPKTPTGLVEASNATKLSVGHVADAGFDPQSGQQVVRLRIIDAATIAKVEADEMAELSPGYEVGLVPVSDAYPAAKAAGCTHVQVYRRVNHLALTKRARGGDSVRLYLGDSLMSTVQSTLIADALTPLAAPQPMPQPMPQMAMPQPAPQMAMPQPMPQMPPAPQPAPMTADEWQKQYDAIMARKPAAPAAAAAAPAPAAPAPAPEAPKSPAEPPKAFDSAMASRAMRASQAATKLGIAITATSTVEGVEAEVARRFVGDSLPANPSADYCRAFVDAALMQPAAPAPAQAPPAVPVAKPSPGTSMVALNGRPVTTAQDALPTVPKADLHPADFYGRG